VFALFAVAVSAAAQSDYPNRPLTFVVPYPPGGAADVFARQLAGDLAKRLGQPVVVDNRAGANGNVGSASVVKAPADGYTLLLGTASTVAINPHLYGKNMPYEPLKDLQPVSGTHSMANVLVVNPATPYKTVQDVVAAAKAKPGALTYASAGNGNTMHLAGEQFRAQAGIDLLHIPYKGGPPAMNDVLGGQVPMMFNNLPAILPMVKSGKLRALAVATPQRSRLMPDVPTMEEAGFKGYVSTVWNGVYVRAGTPRAAVERLNREIVAALGSAELRGSLEAQGFDLIPTTPEQLGQLGQTDSVRWGAVVKASGATID
jgi:tripartite-type tricarboxylate transporter receptor subunit TctC